MFGKINYKLALFSIWAIVLFSYISISAAALNHIFLILPGFYFFYEAIKDKDVRLPKSAVACLLFIVFAAISVIMADDIPNKAKSVFKLKYFIFGILAIFPYRRVLNKLEKKHISYMFNTLFVLLIVGNVFGIIALFDGYHYLRMKKASDGLRAAGMYGMAITYGYGIEYLVIIFTSLLINYKDKLSEYMNKNLMVISLISCYAGLYFSYTRGAILALIISIPFIFIKTKKKLFYGLMSAGVLLIGLLAFLTWNGSDDGNRILLKATTKSNMIRLSQYESALRAFQERPLTGIGYRNLESNVVEIKKRYNIAFPEFAGHAHNNYLEILAGCGIFGFLSFLAFVLFWVFEVWKRTDAMGIVLFPFMISFTVSGLFQNTITDGENMFVIMFIYALSQAFKDNKKLTTA